MLTPRDYLFDMKLHWKKAEGISTPQPVGSCLFCAQLIAGDAPHLVMSRLVNSEGTTVFVWFKSENRSCIRCAKSVGLEW